jgi:hypothetical protein
MDSYTAGFSPGKPAGQHRKRNYMILVSRQYHWHSQ